MMNLVDVDVDVGGLGMTSECDATVLLIGLITSTGLLP